MLRSSAFLDSFPEVLNLGYFQRGRDLVPTDPSYYRASAIFTYLGVKGTIINGLQGLIWFKCKFNIFETKELSRSINRVFFETDGRG